MSAFLTALLTTSLAMSAVILSLLLLHSLLADRLSATLRYSMWLVVLAGLLIPFRPDIELPFTPVRLPGLSEAAALSGAARARAETPRIAPEPARTLSRPEALFGVWAAGVLGFLIVHMHAYGKFISLVRRWSSSERPLSAALAAPPGMGPREGRIAVRTCAFVTSPMLIGYFSPTILLPEEAISADELACVLRHELTHYRRGDLWVNLLLLLVSAMHWFNPLIYPMARAIRTECEASCDEMALAGDDPDRRRQYGETIIGFAGSRSAGSPLLSTYFYGGSRGLKRRLASIMDTGRKSRRLAAACVLAVAAATLLSGGAVAAPPYVGEAAAKAAALSDAGLSESQVRRVKVELDREDGVMVYEVHFKEAGIEYEYEVDAASGVILGSEAERDD